MSKNKQERGQKRQQKKDQDPEDPNRTEGQKDQEEQDFDEDSSRQYHDVKSDLGSMEEGSSNEFNLQDDDDANPDRDRSQDR